MRVRKLQVFSSFFLCMGLQLSSSFCSYTGMLLLFQCRRAHTCIQHMNECFQFLRGLLCLLQDSFVLLPLYPVISQNSTVQVTMYKDSHLPFHVCVALYLVPSEQLYSKVYCDLHVMRCSIRWFIMFEMRMLLLLFQL